MIEYLQDPKPPSIESLLDYPALKMPFYNLALTDLDYSDIFGPLYESEYGEKLAAQDLRYSGRMGYQPRALMAFEYGQDAQPVAHNFTTFLHTLNAINVEGIRGTHKLSAYQKDVVLFSAGIHDAIEGVVGDMPRGTKTPEFRAWEDSERLTMLTTVFAGVLPEFFLHDADDVVGHKKQEIEHDYFELGHTLTQFNAGIRVARICFELLESEAFHLTPWADVEGSDERRRGMATMATQVVKNTAVDLQHFAEKGYWIAGQTLKHHAERILQIQRELGVLAAQ
jgi:hypothetical protein